MKTTLYRFPAHVTSIAILASFAGSTTPAAAQPITNVYVFQDNGYYQTGGTNFPSELFIHDVVRDVDVAWVRVGTGGMSVPITVTSSHPSVLEVQGGISTSSLIPLSVHEPAVPTKVTLTANTVPPTFAKSYSVDVYPPQRVEQVRIVPQKPFYVVGEEVEVEVTMRYAEPYPHPGAYFRELRLDFEPAVDNTAYVQFMSTFGAEVGDKPTDMKLPEERTFRFGMKPLRAEASQALKVSVKCAIYQLELASAPFDECHTGSRIATFRVVDGPRLEKLALTNASLAAGSATTGRLDISYLSSDAPTEISLTSSDPSVTVPATVSLSGSGIASASFPITSTMGAGSRTVTIKATHGEQEVSAILTVEGVLVRDLTVAKPELRAEESFNLVVTLDRPAPGPITVTLTSSDPRAVPLPTQVTFNKGELTKTVSIRAGAATTTTDVRLAGAIAGTPARETAVRVTAGDATAPRTPTRSSTDR